MIFMPVDQWDQLTKGINGLSEHVCFWFDGPHGLPLVHSGTLSSFNNFQILPGHGHHPSSPVLIARIGLCGHSQFSMLFRDSVNTVLAEVSTWPRAA